MYGPLALLTTCPPFLLYSSLHSAAWPLLPPRHHPPPPAPGSGVLASGTPSGLSDPWTPSLTTATLLSNAWAPPTALASGPWAPSYGTYGDSVWTRFTMPPTVSALCTTLTSLPPFCRCPTRSPPAPLAPLTLTHLHDPQTAGPRTLFACGPSYRDLKLVWTAWYSIPCEAHAEG
jgi:hypothetical protein